MSEPRRLCSLHDLSDRSARGFDLAGHGRDAFFLVRVGHSVHAWRNACPHIDDAPMAWRKDAYLSADGTVIVCAAHGARFDIATGQCLLGPCLGEFLTPVAVQIDAQDDVMLLEPLQR